MRRRSTARASLNSCSVAGAPRIRRPDQVGLRVRPGSPAPGSRRSSLRSSAPASSSPRTECRTRSTRTRSGSRLNRVWNASADAICGARSRSSLRAHETRTCSVQDARARQRAPLLAWAIDDAARLWSAAAAAARRAISHHSFASQRGHRVVVVAELAQHVGGVGAALRRRRAHALRRAVEMHRLARPG